jgi:DNA-binding phage protein
MLSEVGNPTYFSFRSVLKALHLKFRVEEDSAFSKRGESKE